MISVDASVLIAQFNPYDVHHSAANQFFLRAASQRFIAHPLTLAEVLVGSVKRQRGHEMLRDLRAIGVEAANHTEDESLWLATLRVQTGLKLPDCCVLFIALSNNAPVATFDDALLKAADRFNLTNAMSLTNATNDMG